MNKKKKNKQNICVYKEADSIDLYFYIYREIYIYRFIIFVKK